MQPAIGDWLISLKWDTEQSVDYQAGDLYLVTGYNRCELRGRIHAGGLVTKGKLNPWERTFRPSEKVDVFDIRDETGFRTNFAKVIDDPNLVFSIALQLATHGVDL